MHFGRVIRLIVLLGHDDRFTFVNHINIIIVAIVVLLSTTTTTTLAQPCAVQTIGNEYASPQATYSTDAVNAVVALIWRLPLIPSNFSWTISGIGIHLSSAINAPVSE